MKLTPFVHIYKNPQVEESGTIVHDVYGLDSCVYMGTEHAKARGKDIIVRCFSYIGDEPETCPVCGARMYKHDYRYLDLVHIPHGLTPVQLQVQIPRRKCSNKECGHMWQPSFPSVLENKGITIEAYRAIAFESVDSLFRHVARKYTLSHTAVRRIFVEFLRENEDRLRFALPRYLGMDEIKVRGLGEITVIVDLEFRTLYDMLLGRKQDFLIDYFSKIPLAERLKVKWVCTDMYRPFEVPIHKLLPNAKWAIDHFHVVMKANEAIDHARIKLQKGMTQTERVTSKSGLAYTLRKRLRDMDPDDKQAIKAIRERPGYSNLAMAFDFKEDFFNIYDNNRDSLENAMMAFDNWEHSLPPEPKVPEKKSKEEEGSSKERHGRSTDEEAYPKDANSTDQDNQSSDEEEYPEDGKGKEWEAIAEKEPFFKFWVLKHTVHHFKEEIFNYWRCDIAITNAYTECANRLIREAIMKGRGYSFEVLRGKELYRYQNLDALLKSNHLFKGPSMVMEDSMFGSRFFKEAPPMEEEEEEDVPF